MKKRIKAGKQKVVSYFTEDKRVFAKDLSLTKLFFIFIVGSVVGVYYEQILNLITHYLDNGSIFWEYRRGVIYGPFNPLYGAGAVLFTWLLLRNDRRWWETILYGGIIGGVFEYVVNFFQEVVMRTSSWNYEGYFLNINGRTTIPFMLAWGIMALIFTDYLYPKISRWIEKIPYRLGQWITVVFAIFMAIDILLSWTALARQTLRRSGVKPFTIVGRIYDDIYNDEALAHYFPNMKPKER